MLSSHFMLVAHAARPLGSLETRRRIQYSVLGLGFRFEFRPQGLRFRVEDWRFKVRGFGAQGSRVRAKSCRV